MTQARKVPGRRSGRRATPSFRDLKASSPAASAAASRASRKAGTRCELVLQSSLRERGLRFELNDPGLPGKPDLVFVAKKVAVFCDGDFWHGRNLDDSIRTLKRGHNSRYWVPKILSNVARDRRNARTLRQLGWRVFRFWETDILRNRNRVVRRIVAALDADRPSTKKSQKKGEQSDAVR